MLTLLFRYKRMAINYISRVKLKYLLATFCIVGVMEYFGAFTHVLELDFDEKFEYPFSGDIREFIENLKNNESPAIAPLNTYNYSFLSNCSKKCENVDNEKLRVVYIVKSAMENFNKRMAIRHSWGFEKRFSDVPIRTVFVLGVHESNKKLQFMVQDEQRKFGDIVQANFIDTYYNNTIKTLMGFNWAMKYCTNSRFYMFADDDMYISTKNVLRFLRNPTQYPTYLETPVIALPVHRSKQLKEFVSKNKDDKNVDSNYFSYKRKLNQVIDFELSDDVKLFAGFVFVSAPHRHRSSKWYVRLSEYPYHMWPPYVTAGAYILSHDALVDMYYGSLYTQHFRFDDIYLGLVAKKVDLEPFHCSEFYFYKKEYNVHSYRYVIASHGFSDPDELLRIWNEQRSAGNA